MRRSVHDDNERRPNTGRGTGTRSRNWPWCLQYIKDFSFENPNAPKSLAGRQEQPQIGIQINVGANPLSETDIEVVIKLDGKAEVAGDFIVPFRAGICRRVSHSECPAGEHEPGRIDRVPAASLPVCARDHRHRGPQWRLSTTPARSGGFRRSLPPEDGATAARSGTCAGLNRQPASGRYSRHSAFSPRLATNSRCAANSASLSRGASTLGALDVSRRYRQPHSPPVHRSRQARAAPDVHRSVRHRPRPKSRHQAARRAWCGVNCRSHSVRTGRQGGWGPPDACGVPATARIDQPLTRYQRAIDAFELGAGETCDRSRHCGSTSGASPIKARNSSAISTNTLVPLQELGGKTMDSERLGRHVAFRIESTHEMSNRSVSG